MTMTLREKAEIVDADGVRRIVTRIAHEIVERNKGVDDLVLVGIKRRGVPLAQRIGERIAEFEGARRRRAASTSRCIATTSRPCRISPSSAARRFPSTCGARSSCSSTTCSTPGGRFAPRWTRLIDFGRPRAIQLAVVIDRGHRELPIRADYVGKNVPTSKKEVIGRQGARGRRRRQRRDQGR
jgi:pyrimidine operon attenuation protein/uracil phosphoribosyltransferase